MARLLPAFAGGVSDKIAKQLALLETSKGRIRKQKLAKVLTLDDESSSGDAGPTDNRGGNHDIRKTISNTVTNLSRTSINLRKVNKFTERTEVTKSIVKSYFTEHANNMGKTLEILEGTTLPARYSHSMPDLKIQIPFCATYGAFLMALCEHNRHKDNEVLLAAVDALEARVLNFVFL